MKRGIFKILNVCFILFASFFCGLASLPQMAQAVNTATITVGGNVFAVAITPDGNYVYVTSAGKVSMIDTATNMITDSIDIRGCDDVAITPNGKYAYILTSIQDPQTGSTHSVTVMDTETKKVTTTINLDGAFNDLSITPNGDYVYVTEQDIVDMKSVGVVSVINTVTNTVIKKVTVEGSPEAVAITPNGEYAYVTSSGSIPSIGSSQGKGIVSVIDTATNTVIAKITVGVAPQNIAIAPNGAYAYVTNSGSDSVSVIDTATNTVSISITGLSHPLDVVITPNGEYAYVTEQDFENSVGKVAVINTTTNSVTATIELIPYPHAAAITPNGKYVYITNGVNGTVSVISTDTNTVIDVPSAAKEFPFQWLIITVLAVITVLTAVIIIAKRRRKSTDVKPLLSLSNAEQASARNRFFAPSNIFCF